MFQPGNRPSLAVSRRATRLGTGVIKKSKQENRDRDGRHTRAMSTVHKQIGGCRHLRCARRAPVDRHPPLHADDASTGRRSAGHDNGYPLRPASAPSLNTAAIVRPRTATDNPGRFARPSRRQIPTGVAVGFATWQEKVNLFGEELRRLRRRSGLSQETLAARAGLSPEAVSLLERGRRSPRMTTMRLLPDAAGFGESDRSRLVRLGQPPEEPPTSLLPVFADHPVGRDNELRELAKLIERDDTEAADTARTSRSGKGRDRGWYVATSRSGSPTGCTGSR